MKEIEILKKEIEIFKQNIANSNNLVSDLQDSVEALKEYNSGINNLANEFSNRVPQKLLEILSASYAKSNSEINAVFDKKVSELLDAQDIIKEDITKLEAFTREISSVIIETNSDICNSIREEISCELKEYPYNNRQYIDNLISCLHEAEVKIDQLSERITSVNEDVLRKIHVLCEDKSVENQIKKMNDNLNNKFMPIYFGMALMAIICIAQFFI